MSNLFQLLPLLQKQIPHMRFGALLSVLGEGALNSISDEELIRRISLVLQFGLTVRPRRVVMPVGLPGSGKSTFTKELIWGRSEGTRAVICSTDDFFMDGGVYRFDFRKLVEYHARNFQRFVLALVDGVDLVVVDNTNLRAEHREPYVRLAKAMGYEVEMPVIGGFTEEDCVTYAGRNVHGVPLDGLRRMAASVQVPAQE